MSRSTHIRREFRHVVSSPFAIAALVVVLALPLLYGAFYIWAFWDPTSHINRLPVSIVNLDRGASANSKAAHAGDDLVRELRSTATLDWQLRSEASAKAALSEGHTYATLVIPADFSARAASLATPSQATAAQLQLVLDDGNSYLAGSIISRVMTAVRDEAAIAVTTTATHGLVDGLSQAQRGFAAAATGSGRLQTGTSAALQGGSKIAAGLTQLEAGSAALASATGKFANSGAELMAGVNKVAAGSVAVADGSKTLATTLAALAAHPEAATGATLKALADKGTALATGAASVANGATQLESGTAQASVAANAIATGAAKLDSGIISASNGMTTLNGGLASLNHGAAELASKLQTGSASIPVVAAGDKYARTVANPVTLSATNLHPAGNYGTGFSQYFIALALWIGGVFLFGLFHPVARRREDEPVHATRRVLSGWAMISILGALQAVLVWMVLHFWVGLDAVHPALFLGFLVLCAMAFAAILQFLHAAFGNVGRVLAVALLVLQMAAGAGTYPTETSPAVLQSLRPWLPLSHAYTALRHLIVGGSLDVVREATIVLVAIAAVSMLASVVVTRLGREQTVATDLSDTGVPAYES